jgi:hypothetical protein
MIGSGRRRRTPRGTSARHARWPPARYAIASHLLNTASSGPKNRPSRKRPIFFSPTVSRSGTRCSPYSSLLPFCADRPIDKGYRVARGSRPNLARRRRIARLRARGWSYARIAHSLGITKQAVAYTQTVGLRRGTAICSHCQKQFDAAEGTKKIGDIYCLSCLSRLRDVPIGRRIASLRTILGFTQGELAKQSGLGYGVIHVSVRRSPSCGVW